MPKKRQSEKVRNIADESKQRGTCIYSMNQNLKKEQKSIRHRFCRDRRGKSSIIRQFWEKTPQNWRNLKFFSKSPIFLHKPIDKFGFDGKIM